MSAAVSAITVGSVRVHAVGTGYVLDLGSAGDASGGHRLSLHTYPATVLCGTVGYQQPVRDCQGVGRHGCDCMYRGVEAYAAFCRWWPALGE